MLLQINNTFLYGDYWVVRFLTLPVEEIPAGREMLLVGGGENSVCSADVKNIIMY